MPKFPSCTAVELDPSVGSFWSEKGIGDTWQGPASLEGVVGDSGAVPHYGWASSTRRRRSDARGLSQTQSSSASPESSTREKPVRRKGEEPETTLLRDHGKTVVD